ASSQAVISQQAQPVGQKKENAHTLFTRANQYYVNGDYDGAAKICVELQSRLPELNATERKDLPAIIQKNNHALQLRRDAGIQLTKATKLLQQPPPRLKEAEDLVKNAGANPYTDPKQLAMVNQQINEIRQHGTTVQQPTGSPKAMFAEGRIA